MVHCPPLRPILITPAPEERGQKGKINAKKFLEAVKIGQRRICKENGGNRKVLCRKKSSEKAVATKRKNAEAILDEIIETLVVVRLDLTELRDLTLRAKQDWYDWHDGGLIIDPDAETVERWMVNFIRHRLCQYDSGLMDIFGKVGKQELYQRLKVETIEKISDVYPELSDECHRQISFSTRSEPI